MFDSDKKWNVNQPGTVANIPEFTCPDRQKMEEEYKLIINELENERGDAEWNRD